MITHATSNCMLLMTDIKPNKAARHVAVREVFHTGRWCEELGMVALVPWGGSLLQYPRSASVDSGVLLARVLNSFSP